MATLSDEVFAHALEIASTMDDINNAEEARERMLIYCSAHPRREEVERILIDGANSHTADFTDPIFVGREYLLRTGAAVIVYAAMECL